MGIRYPHSREQAIGFQLRQGRGKVAFDEQVAALGENHGPAGAHDPAELARICPLSGTGVSTVTQARPSKASSRYGNGSFLHVDTGEGSIDIPLCGDVQRPLRHIHAVDGAGKTQAAASALPLRPVPQPASRMTASADSAARNREATCLGASWRHSSSVASYSSAQSSQ
ncbi:MAG: hypothetical protein U5K33_08635 [Halofilum sp. (in: g-proteobacteria)]|nr:hypothetical protein [Halofilum sp. (in: g-proteobacteria)]